MTTQDGRVPQAYFDALQVPLTGYGAKLILQRSGIPQQQGKELTIPYEVVGVFYTSLEHLKMMAIHITRKIKAFEKIHGKVMINKDILERDKIDLKAEWDGQEYQGSLEHLKLMIIQCHRLLKAHEDRNGKILLPDEDIKKFEVDLAKEW